MNKNFVPACYQDLVEGKTIYHKVDGKMVEIVPLGGTHHSTISGYSYLMHWRWKDMDYGGSRGQLYKERYKTLSDYHLYTQSSCILFVENTDEN